MRTIILSLLCIFTFTLSSFAQWTEQTSGVSVSIYSV